MLKLAEDVEVNPAHIAVVKHWPDDNQAEVKLVSGDAWKVELTPELLAALNTLGWLVPSAPPPEE